MADDDLDLSEFEEFSSTARSAQQPASPPPSRVRAKGAGGRRWLWLIVGIVIGAAGTLFLPRLVAPYLPEVLRPEREVVRGPVLAKRVSGDRLLLTMDAGGGALLATFTQRVAEIDLLVEEGDTVTLGIDAYAPFVEDPVLTAVTKRDASGSEAAGESGAEDTGAGDPDIEPARPPVSPESEVPEARPADTDSVS